mgnify:CR=1 FL=1
MGLLYNLVLKLGQRTFFLFTKFNLTAFSLFCFRQIMLIFQKK